MNGPSRADLKAAFLRENATLVSAGLKLSDAEKAIQWAVINGTLSCEEAIEAIIHAAD
jgi:hypothetical protein